MKYKNIIQLLHNTPNQPPKFRTKSLVEINNDFCGRYKVSIQVKFRTSMFKSSLSDYSRAYIHIEGATTVPNTGTPAVLKIQRIEI